MNYQSQFNLKQPVASVWDLQQMLMNNFTYTVVALGKLNVTTASKIQTSRFGGFANTVFIDGSIDASSRGCIGG